MTTQSTNNKQAEHQRDKDEAPPPSLLTRLSNGVEMAQQGYEALVNAIIRPPRCSYNYSSSMSNNNNNNNNKQNALGPADFEFLQARFTRHDVELQRPNHHQRPPSDDNDGVPSFLNIQASIWTRKNNDDDDDDNNNNNNNDSNNNNNEKKDETKTMVVYLHGNASARIEAVPNLSFLLACGVFGVAALDFTGSGQSDGEYVTLGYYERIDLQVLLEHLQREYGGNESSASRPLQIVLWGRSMGAVTALMHAAGSTNGSTTTTTTTTNSHETTQQQQEKNNRSSQLQQQKHSSPIVKGLVCDSPFCSLPVLCQELVVKARSQGLVVPDVVVSVALAVISRSVRNRAAFTIADIAPIQHVKNLDTPALFICGATDDFIPPHHSEQLIEAYQRGVRTNLFMVDGGHNDARPPLVFEAIRQFLQQYLPGLSSLDVPPAIQKTYLQYPPWAFYRQAAIFKTLATTTTATNSVANGDAGTAKKNDDKEEEEEEEEESLALGMTKERQEDIQNKIQTAFGQGPS